MKERRIYPKRDPGDSTCDGDEPVWLQRWHVVVREAGAPPNRTRYCNGICTSWKEGEPYEPHAVVQTDSGVYPPNLGGPAELIAFAPMLLRDAILREWSEMQDMNAHYDVCSRCCGHRGEPKDVVFMDSRDGSHSRERVTGHKPRCLLDALLTSVGLKTQRERDAARARIRQEFPRDEAGR